MAQGSHVVLIEEIMHTPVQKSKNEWGHRQLMARGQGFGQVSEVLGDFARRNAKDKFVKLVDEKSHVFYFGYFIPSMLVSHKIRRCESFF